MAETRVYYGTKRVEAWPKTAPAFRPATADEMREANLLAPDTLSVPTGEMRAGYAIRYPDGYVSWSPKEVFEAAYHVETDLPFEGALAAMREGRKVRRTDVDPRGVTIWLDVDGQFLCQREGMSVGAWHPFPADLSTRRWTVVE